MKAPEECLYCDGDGNSKAGGSCGFCVGGKPLDTQEDWDNSWGRILRDRRINEGKICGACGEWPEYCGCD